MCNNSVVKYSDNFCSKQKKTLLGELVGYWITKDTKPFVQLVLDQ